MAQKISPTAEEFREAQEIIENSLTKAEAEFSLERDVIIEIGLGGHDDIVEMFDGVYGFASYPNEIELKFNTAAENWRQSLKSTTVHEYAHVWGFEQRGRESSKKWEYILEEAFTQHTAKQFAPEYQSQWWTEHGTQTVAAYWEQVKENELDQDSEDAGPLFINSDDEGYSLGLGYSLSFQIGQELLGEHKLSDLLTLSKSELVRAGDNLYQHER
ncbi:DUF2268 domain-containing putative Zn-dependent protease [Halobacterium yunchengense]|uniref:DUF2268 domain-containing putative Zn-dependent protease n=1 Tax=Halobacterium yunchengense TaxID=3108497 RepID=UPI00300ACCB1